MNSCFTLNFQVMVEMVRSYKFLKNMVKSIILAKFTYGIVLYVLLYKGYTSLCYKDNASNKAN
jgi:hypothetical protein